MTKQFALKALLTLVLIGSAFHSQAQINNATLIWDPNVETDLAGYKMYYGVASGLYTTILDVGNVTTNTVTGLLNGTTYFFAVTAYNTSGLESDFSNEVSYTPGSQANAPPTLDPIIGITINEDAGPQTVSLTGISSGALTEIQTLSLSAISSNPALIANPAITYTSPNTTGTLTLVPLANANGSVVITVTVDDGGATNNLFSQNFTVKVSAPNTPPTISAIPNQTIQKNQSTAPLPFTIGDATTPAANLILSGASSNPTLVPASQIVFGGNNSNRTVKVTPSKGKTGTALITISVSDGTLQASSAFLLTVLATGGTTATATLASPLPAGEGQGEGSFKILTIYQQSTPQLSTNNLTPDTRHLTLTVSDPLTLDTRHLTPTVSLTWQSTPGSTYRVLYKNTLDSPAWTDGSGDITAEDSTTSWNDLTAQGVPSRYYRVLLVQ